MSNHRHRPLWDREREKRTNKKTHISAREIFDKFEA